jgi:hypothetical protein
MESTVYTPGAGTLPPVPAGRDALLRTLLLGLNDTWPPSLVGCLAAWRVGHLLAVFSRICSRRGQFEARSDRGAIRSRVRDHRFRR